MRAHDSGPGDAVDTVVVGIGVVAAVHCAGSVLTTNAPPQMTLATASRELAATSAAVENEKPMLKKPSLQIGTVVLDETSAADPTAMSAFCAARVALRANAAPVTFVGKSVSQYP